jgi:cytochrome c biogenesis protein CcdA
MTDATSNEPSTNAVLSLVFGILAVAGVCPCIGGVIAIVLGTGQKSGVGRAGWILGVIHLAMLAFVLVAALVLLAIGAVGAAVNN